MNSKANVEAMQNDFLSTNQMVESVWRSYNEKCLHIDQRKDPELYKKVHRVFLAGFFGVFQAFIRPSAMDRTAMAIVLGTLMAEADMYINRTGMYANLDKDPSKLN